MGRRWNLHFTILGIIPNLFNKGLIRMNHSYIKFVVAPPPERRHSDVTHFEEGVIKALSFNKESAF